MGTQSVKRSEDMTVHAAKQGANGGPNGSANGGANGRDDGGNGGDDGRTPTPQENENRQDEEHVVRAVDLTNDELKKLLPELENDPEGMRRIEKIRDVQKNHDEVFEEYIKAKNELEDKFEQKFSPLFQVRFTHSYMNTGTRIYDVL